MKHRVLRVVTVAAILALVAALTISTFVFAAGPAGSQVQAGTHNQYGQSYGPGDGSGPLGGGQFGSGPHCVDANHNGICDCKE
jgi:hypothetical protein